MGEYNQFFPTIRGERTSAMQTATLFLLVAMATAAYAAGQYYVPRSYYVIDAEGHESDPVPLRRLRRSLDPYPYLNRREARSPSRAKLHEDSAHVRLGHGRHLTSQGAWRTLHDNSARKP